MAPLRDDFFKAFYWFRVIQVKLGVLLFSNGFVGFYECFTIGWVCFCIKFFGNNCLDGLLNDEVFFCLLVFRSIGYLRLSYD